MNVTNGTYPLYDLQALYSYQCLGYLDTAFLSEIIAVNVVLLVLSIVFFRKEPLKSRGIIPQFALTLLLISNCVRIATNFTALYITLAMVPIQIGALTMVWIPAITQWIRYLVKQHREYNKQNNSNQTLIQKIIHFVFVSNAGLFLFLLFCTFCVLLIMMGLWLSYFVTFSFSVAVVAILIVLVVGEILLSAFLIITDLLVDVYRYGLFSGTYTLRDPLAFRKDGIFLLVCCVTSAVYMIFSNLYQSYIPVEGISQRVVGLYAPIVFLEHISLLSTLLHK